MYFDIKTSSTAWTCEDELDVLSSEGMPVFRWKREKNEARILQIFGSFWGCFSKLLGLLCKNVAPKLCEVARPDNRARSGRGARLRLAACEVRRWLQRLIAPLTSLWVHNGGLCARVLEVKARAKYSIVIWCRLWLPGKNRRLLHTHQLNGQLKRNFCCSRPAPSDSPYLNPPDTQGV